MDLLSFVIFFNTLQIVVFLFLLFLLVFFAYEVVQVLRTGEQYYAFDTHVFSPSPLNAGQYRIDASWRSGNNEDSHRGGPSKKSKKKRKQKREVFGHLDKEWPTSSRDSTGLLHSSSVAMRDKMNTPTFLSSRTPGFVSSSVLPSITVYDWLSVQYVYRLAKKKALLQERETKRQEDERRRNYSYERSKRKRDSEEYTRHRAGRSAPSLFSLSSSSLASISTSSSDSRLARSYRSVDNYSFSTDVVDAWPISSSSSASSFLSPISVDKDGKVVSTSTTEGDKKGKRENNVGSREKGPTHRKKKEEPMPQSLKRPTGDGSSRDRPSPPLDKERDATQVEEGRRFLGFFLGSPASKRKKSERDSPLASFPSQTPVDRPLVEPSARPSHRATARSPTGVVPPPQKKGKRRKERYHNSTLAPEDVIPVHLEEKQGSLVRKDKNKGKKYPAKGRHDGDGDRDRRGASAVGEAEWWRRTSGGKVSHENRHEEAERDQWERNAMAMQKGELTARDSPPHSLPSATSPSIDDGASSSFVPRGLQPTPHDERAHGERAAVNEDKEGAPCQASLQKRPGGHMREERWNVYGRPLSCHGEEVFSLHGRSPRRNVPSLSPYAATSPFSWLRQRVRRVFTRSKKHADGRAKKQSGRGEAVLGKQKKRTMEVPASSCEWKYEAVWGVVLPALLAPTKRTVRAMSPRPPPPSIHERGNEKEEPLRCRPLFHSSNEVGGGTASVRPEVPIDGRRSSSFYESSLARPPPAFLSDCGEMRRSGAPPSRMSTTSTHRGGGRNGVRQEGTSSRAFLQLYSTPYATTLDPASPLSDACGSSSSSCCSSCASSLGSSSFIASSSSPSVAYAPFSSFHAECSLLLSGRIGYAVRRDPLAHGGKTWQEAAATPPVSRVPFSRPFTPSTSCTWCSSRRCGAAHEQNRFPSFFPSSSTPVLPSSAVYRLTYVFGAPDISSLLRRMTTLAAASFPHPCVDSLVTSSCRLSSASERAAPASPGNAGFICFFYPQDYESAHTRSKRQWHSYVTFFRQQLQKEKEAHAEKKNTREWRDARPSSDDEKPPNTMGRASVRDPCRPRKKPIEKSASTISSSSSGASSLSSSSSRRCSTEPGGSSVCSPFHPARAPEGSPQRRLSLPPLSVSMIRDQGRACPTRSHSPPLLLSPARTLPPSSAGSSRSSSTAGHSPPAIPRAAMKGTSHRSGSTPQTRTSIASLRSPSPLCGTLPEEDGTLHGMRTDSFFSCDSSSRASSPCDEKEEPEGGRGDEHEHTWPSLSRSVSGKAAEGRRCSRVGSPVAERRALLSPPPPDALAVVVEKEREAVDTLGSTQETPSAVPPSCFDVQGRWSEALPLQVGHSSGAEVSETTEVQDKDNNKVPNAATPRHEVRGRGRAEDGPPVHDPPETSSAPLSRVNTTDNVTRAEEGGHRRYAEKEYGCRSGFSALAQRAVALEVSPSSTGSSPSFPVAHRTPSLPSPPQYPCPASSCSAFSVTHSGWCTTPPPLQWCWGTPATAQLHVSPHDLDHFLCIAAPSLSFASTGDPADEIEEEGEEEGRPHHRHWGRKWKRKTASGISAVGSRSMTENVQKTRSPRRQQRDVAPSSHAVVQHPVRASRPVYVIWPQQLKYLPPQQSSSSLVRRRTATCTEVPSKLQKEEAEEKRKGHRGALSIFPPPFAPSPPATTATNGVLPLQEDPQEKFMQAEEGDVASVPRKRVEPTIGMKGVLVSKEEEETVGKDVVFLSTLIWECVCRDLDTAQIILLDRYWRVPQPAWHSTRPLSPPPSFLAAPPHMGLTQTPSKDSPLRPRHKDPLGVPSARLEGRSTPPSPRSTRLPSLFSHLDAPLEEGTSTSGSLLAPAVVFKPKSSLPPPIREGKWRRSASATLSERVTPAPLGPLPSVVTPLPSSLTAVPPSVWDTTATPPAAGERVATSELVSACPIPRRQAHRRCRQRQVHQHVLRRNARVDARIRVLQSNIRLAKQTFPSRRKRLARSVWLREQQQDKKDPNQEKWCEFTSPVHEELYYEKPIHTTEEELAMPALLQKVQRRSLDHTSSHRYRSGSIHSNRSGSPWGRRLLPPPPSSTPTSFPSLAYLSSLGASTRTASSLSSSLCSCDSLASSSTLENIPIAILLFSPATHLPTCLLSRKEEEKEERSTWKPLLGIVRRWISWWRSARGRRQEVSRTGSHTWDTQGVASPPSLLSSSSLPLQEGIERERPASANPLPLPPSARVSSSCSSPSCGTDPSFLLSQFHQGQYQRLLRCHADGEAHEEVLPTVPSSPDAAIILLYGASVKDMLEAMESTIQRQRQSVVGGTEEEEGHEKGGKTAHSSLSMNRGEQKSKARRRNSMVFSSSSLSPSSSGSSWSSYAKEEVRRGGPLYRMRFPFLRFPVRSFRFTYTARRRLSTSSSRLGSSGIHERGAFDGLSVDSGEMEGTATAAPVLFSDATSELPSTDFPSFEKSEDHSPLLGRERRGSWGPSSLLPPCSPVSPHSPALQRERYSSWEERSATQDSFLSSFIRPKLPPLISHETVHRMAVRLGPVKEENGNKGIETKAATSRASTEEWKEKPSEGDGKEGGLQVPVTLRYIRLGNVVYHVTPIVDYSVVWYEELRHARLPHTFPSLSDEEKPNENIHSFFSSWNHTHRNDLAAERTLDEVERFRTRARSHRPHHRRTPSPTSASVHSTSTVDSLLVHSRRAREEDEEGARSRSRSSSGGRYSRHSFHGHSRRHRRRPAASTLSFQKNLLSIACRNDGTQRAIHLCRNCMVQKADVIILPCGDFAWCHTCLSERYRDHRDGHGTSVEHYATSGNANTLMCPLCEAPAEKIIQLNSV